MIYFFETLLLMIWWETIKFSVKLKRTNESKETELENEISELEPKLNDNSVNDLVQKNVSLKF